MQTIENIQRRATKLVNTIKNLTYEERLEQLNLPTLLYRRERYDQIQLYKIVNNVDNINVDKFVQFNDNITRGHIFKIIKPRVNRHLTNCTFPYRCIDCWNNLEEDIVTSDSVLAFKSKLDIAWTNKRFDTSVIY